MGLVSTCVPLYQPTSQQVELRDLVDQGGRADGRCTERRRAAIDAVADLIGVIQRRLDGVEGTPGDGVLGDRGADLSECQAGIAAGVNGGQPGRLGYRTCGRPVAPNVDPHFRVRPEAREGNHVQRQPTIGSAQGPLHSRGAVEVHLARRDERQIRTGGVGGLHLDQRAGLTHAAVIAAALRDEHRAVACGAGRQGVHVHGDGTAGVRERIGMRAHVVLRETVGTRALAQGRRGQPCPHDARQDETNC